MFFQCDQLMISDFSKLPCLHLSKTLMCLIYNLNIYQNKILSSDRQSLSFLQLGLRMGYHFLLFHQGLNKFIIIFSYHHILFAMYTPRSVWSGCRKKLEVPYHIYLTLTLLHGYLLLEIVMLWIKCQHPYHFHYR